MRTKEAVLQTIERAVRDCADLDDVNAAIPQDTLLTDLGIDSLEIYNVVCELEAGLNIEIKDSTLDSVETYGDLRKAVLLLTHPT